MVIEAPSKPGRRHPILDVLKREGRMVSWLRARLAERPEVRNGRGQPFEEAHLSLILNGHRATTPELRRACVDILGSYRESELFHPAAP